MLDKYSKTNKEHDVVCYVKVLPALSAYICHSPSQYK